MDTPKIISITSTLDPQDNTVKVYGLGEDNKVYMWDGFNGAWGLNGPTAS